MSAIDTAITHLDRLIAAMERGAPDAEIARLRATYEQAEDKAMNYMAAFGRLFEEGKS